MTEIERKLRVEKEVVLDGRKYLFDGTSWHDMASFFKPPAAIIARLDESIKEDLQKEDEAIASFEQCMQIAQKSKFNGTCRAKSRGGV